MDVFLLEHTDLTRHPYVMALEKKSGSFRISTGDLHGNALKLVYILIQQGFLTLQHSNDYDVLRDIYNTPVDKLTRVAIQKYNDIIQQATIHTKQSLTLIGDELADRGHNDYFTLRVLKKLHDSNLSFDVMVSNHGFEFLKDYYNSPNRISFSSTLGYHFAQSLVGLSLLCEKFPEIGPQVQHWVETSYLPHLKAIGYSLSFDGKSITLYTHAPVGFETIEVLARQYGVDYDASTIGKLIHTIDKMNEAFRQQLQTGTLYERTLPRGRVGDLISTDYSLYRLIWNRSVSSIQGSPPEDAYHVDFVHGHIGLEPQNQLGLRSHYNLDNNCGKYPGAETEPYAYAVSEEVRESSPRG